MAAAAAAELNCRVRCSIRFFYHVFCVSIIFHLKVLLHQVFNLVMRPKAAYVQLGVSMRGRATIDNEIGDRDSADAHE